MKLKYNQSKYFILYILIAAFSLSIVSAQESEHERSTLNKTERKVLFNREFTSALSNVPNNSIGNYANVDFKAATASFATSFVRDGSVLTFNVSGGSNDKTLRFINNNDFNYNFSFGAQYHFIDASKKISLIVDVDQWEAYRAKEKKIIDDAETQIKAIENEHNLKKLKNLKYSYDKTLDSLKSAMYSQLDNIIASEKEKIQDQIKVINIRLLDADNYKNGIAAYQTKKNNALALIKDCFTTNCIQKRVAIQEDRAVKETLLNKKSIEQEKKNLEEQIKHLSYDWMNSSDDQIIAYRTKIKKIEKDIQSVEQQIKQLKTQKGSLIKDIYSKKARELKKHREKGFTTYGSSFNWFSLGLRTALSSFILYDGSLPYQEQLKEKEAINYELTLQYSWHKRDLLNKWGSYLVNLGTSITYGDNQGLLARRTLEERTVRDSQNGTERITQSETQVLIGEYKDDIAGMRIYTDAYYFLAKGNVAAIHLYPNVQLTEEQKPIYNTEIGLVLSYKKQKDPSNLANAELFYSFNDMRNTLESDEGFFERNTVGLRLTFPISF